MTTPEAWAQESIRRGATTKMTLKAVLAEVFREAQAEATKAAEERCIRVVEAVGLYDGSQREVKDEIIRRIREGEEAE